MGLQITNQADYATRAMLFIARLGPGKLVPSNIIAEEMHMSRMFLSRINSHLSKAGLIRTRRGARGGISLAKDPSEISVFDIVTAIDGPIHLIHCTKDPDCCNFGENCPLQRFWLDSEEVLVQKLKNTSLAELAAVSL
ncbi:MAG: RrF2 family transcriptional regulator [Anaerolineaceae bacterium]|jgi:Rrf2 family protein